MLGMYVQWGAFSFLPSEAGISLTVDNKYSLRGFPETTEVRFTIHGEICADGEYATEERLEEIRQAFAFNYQDIVYRHSDGTPSSHSLANNDPFNLSGNRILMASYPETKDGEFVSGRRFTIVIGATLKTNGISTVMSYNDNLHFVGNGGEQWTWELNEQDATYYPVLVATNSKQQIHHYGEKVTTDTWHLPPTPFWPPPIEDNVHREVCFKSPIVFPNGAIGYKTTWSYTSELYGVSADTLRPRTGYL